MIRVLATIPRLSFPVMAAIVLVAAAGVLLWLWWLRRRGAYARDHLVTGLSLVGMVALFLFILSRLGEVHINAYGAALVLGFLAGMATARRLARRRGIAGERMMDLGLIALLGGVIGARVLYVIITPDAGPIFAFNSLLRGGLSGLSFHGGLAGGVLAGSIYLALMRLPFWRVADCTAPAIAIGHAVTRVGCFLNGCCLGRPADLPWAVAFPHPAEPALAGIPVHPTQLYASAMLLVIYGMLLLLSRGASLGRAGRLFMVFLVLEGAERFVMEIFRYPDPRYQGAMLTPAQGISILVAAVGIVGWFLLPKQPAVMEPAPDGAFDSRDRPPAAAR